MPYIGYNPPPSSWRQVHGAIANTDLSVGAVTSHAIAIDAVTIPKLAATGTASNSTFLRGDNAWAAGSGGSSLTVADEGGNLSSAATTLDFVGAGVVASGTGATKTITITGSGGGSTNLDDITVGDAASTLATTVGSITLDAQGTDTDIIFKGTDGGVDTTFLTLDGSEAGKAIFTSDISVAGTITSTAGGTPTLTSASNINIPVGGSIVVQQNSGGGGFRLGNLTTTQRNALSAANGEMIYNTTTNKIQGYQNGAWVDLA